MGLEMQVLAEDIHKDVEGLNQLMGSQPSSRLHLKIGSQLTAIQMHTNDKTMRRFASTQKDHMLSQK